MHIESVAIIVDDYDAAIDFFVIWPSGARPAMRRVATVWRPGVSHAARSSSTSWSGCGAAMNVSRRSWRVHVWRWRSREKHTRSWSCSPRARTPIRRRRRDRRARRRPHRGGDPAVEGPLDLPGCLSRAASVGGSLRVRQVRGQAVGDRSAHVHGVPVGLEYRGQGAIVGEAYSSPYPTGNSGSALSSGTSVSCAWTAVIEDGNSNGRSPPGRRCPAIVCMRTVSETP